MSVPRPTPEALTVTAKILDELRRILDALPPNPEYDERTAVFRDALAAVAAFTLEIWEVLGIPDLREQALSGHVTGISGLVNEVAAPGLVYVLAFARPAECAVCYASNAPESDVKAWLLRSVLARVTGGAVPPSKVRH